MSFADPFSLFEPAFAQRALVAVLLVAVAAGALGGTIVLRDLPFFTHAVGTGAYPVLVLGLLVGVAVAPAAIVGTIVFAVLVGTLSGLGRGTRPADDPGRRDALIGLAVAGALAVGSVLAATAGATDARLAVSPEALLFGSVLTVSGGAIIASAIAVAVVVVAAFLLRDRWLAAGFDPPLARQLRASRTDLILLACVALAVGAALPVTGSLLAGALLIAPAATARIVVRRARSLPLLTFAIAVFVGVFGLYLSLNFDLPAGAAIAAVAGAVFLVTAAVAAVLAARPTRRTQIATAATLLVALALAGCGGGSSDSTDSEDGTLKVVATTPQVADIVQNVGGKSVTVETILPAGADPHDFEPKPSAVAAISKADIVFRSGGDVDAWLLPAMDAAGGDVTQVDLSRSAVLLPAGDEHDEATFNAHWYLAPDNVVRATTRVRDELIKSDPEPRETYRANATEYIGETQALNEKIDICQKGASDAERRLLAGHNDFNYLTDSMEYEIVAQIAESGESEPSASDLQSAVDDARSADARALLVSKGEVTSLAEKTASSLQIPLLELWADSLAKSGQASTLLGSIAYDSESIFKATTGKSCPEN